MEQKQAHEAQQNVSLMFLRHFYVVFFTHYWTDAWQHRVYLFYTTKERNIVNGYAEQLSSNRL